MQSQYIEHAQHQALASCNFCAIDDKVVESALMKNIFKSIIDAIKRLFGKTPETAAGLQNENSALLQINTGEFNMSQRLKRVDSLDQGDAIVLYSGNDSEYQALSKAGFLQGIANNFATTAQPSDTVEDGQIFLANDGRQYRNASGDSAEVPTSFPATGFEEYGPPLTEDQILQLAKTRQQTPNVGEPVAIDQVVIANDGRQYRNVSGAETVMPDTFPTAEFQEYRIEDGIFGYSAPVPAINSPSAGLLRFNLTAQGTGAGNVIQGFAEDPFTGELFTLHVTGSPRLGVLNKYHSWASRTQTSHRWNQTPSSIVGRQELEIVYDKRGNRWFLTAANEAVTEQANHFVKFQVEDGPGTNDLVITNDSLVKIYEGGLTAGSSTGCVSLCGKHYVTEKSGNGFADIKVFDMQAILDSPSSDFSGEDAYLSRFSFPIDETDFPIQSLLSDGKLVYIFTGFGPIVGQPLQCHIYTLQGRLVSFIDDFRVGEAEALADPTGYYEMEGAGWLWYQGTPRPAISIASGASGDRTNRVWILGSNIPHTSYGDGNRPAFLSSGSNDYGVPSNESLRLGHYDPETDTFQTDMLILPDGKLDVGDRNKGDITVTIESETTRGTGDISPTTTTGTFERTGNLIYVEFRFLNIDISTFANAAGNFYIHMEAVNADSNFDPASTLDVPLAGFFGNDIEFLPGVVKIQPIVDNAGHINLREIVNDGTNGIMNAAQIDGADITINGTYKVA